VLIQPGRVNNILSAGAGDDVVNPGLGIDFASGGFGDDLLILDYSQGDDANVGGVAFEGGQYFRRHDLGTDAIIDSIYTSGFERVQITGGSKADTFIGLDGNDTFNGGAGNDTINSGYGDDVLDGGPGADTMTGGPGNDIYIVDNPADVINEGAGGGYDTVIFTIGGPLTQPANIEKIIFMASATLPSLDIGPNGLVILSAESAPPTAHASAFVGAMLAADSGVNEIARLQATAGTPSAQLPIENNVPPLAEFAASAAHSTADIMIANPMTPCPELFAHGFTPNADTTHDIWHNEPALAPLDFDVIDAIP
jgi:Ca2+-binding RTX toxin-like protein